MRRQLLQAVLACAAAALALAAAAPRAAQQPDLDEGLAGVDLASATLSQSGKLRLSVVSYRPIRPRLLRHICLHLRHAAGDPANRNLCLARLRRVGDVKRVGERKIVATFAPQDAAIAPGARLWWVTAGGDRVPDQGAVRIRISRAQQVGCKRRGSPFIFHGPSNRRRIALTFDDGPSSYTAQIASQLRRYGAHATFFELGKETGGRAATMRRLIEDGNEIGNHSYNHANLAGGGTGAAAQIAATNARIKAASGFRPCLFRAPYGAAGNDLIAVARKLGMTTVQWNVDPRDWSLAGTGAIYSGVVDAAAPGSIVAMHDGGGPRGQTAAALGPILRTLTRRGYELVTVSQLLGYEPVYRSRAG